MRILVFLIICFYSVSSAACIKKAGRKLKSNVEVVTKRSNERSFDKVMIKALKKIRKKDIQKLKRVSF